jgi:hypothetical protein
VNLRQEDHQSILILLIHKRLHVPIVVRKQVLKIRTKIPVPRAFKDNMLLILNLTLIALKTNAMPSVSNMMIIAVELPRVQAEAHHSLVSNLLKGKLKVWLAQVALTMKPRKVFVPQGTLRSCITGATVFRNNVPN